MNIITKNIINHGHYIHYVDTKNESNHALIPLLICPGLSETAEEYVDLLTSILPRRGIVLSFRGRGQSGTPLNGYDLGQHVTDIVSVVDDARITRFHILGNSRGVSYALGYARSNSNKVASLILIDYPLEHKAMSEEWADDYIHNYLVPCNRIDNIRPAAVRGIQTESTQESLQFHYEEPVLVIRGLLEGSLVSNHELEKYKNSFMNIEIEEFQKSGHDIRVTERALLYKKIIDFID